MVGRVVDLFSGAGGWSMGLRAIGGADVGVELWEPATRTAHAAGHAVIRADVAKYPAEVFAGWEGLIASPPCQTFSAAGKKEGAAAIGAIRSHLLACRHGWVRPSGPVADPRSELMLEPLRWVWAVRPRWVALEQVPGVLPLWQTYSLVLAELGYEAWCGVVNAADYGVPQDRRRAVLLASMDGEPGRPRATHGGNGLPPLVSMSDALGWSGWVNTGRAWQKGGDRSDAQCVDASQPAPTVTGQSGGQWRIHPRAEVWRAMTVPESLVLQSFPADYPVGGNTSEQALQVGNAVPPLLAEALLREVTTCQPRRVRTRTATSFEPVTTAEQVGMFA